MTPILSPLPYLAQVPDPREHLKTRYRWQDLLLICLLAVGSGRNNILAISQWVNDQASFLLDQVGIRTCQGERQLPAQATLYRFFWALSEGLEPLQQALLSWAQDVGRALGHEGPLAIAADGKHLRGTRRVRRGEEALVFLSALVQGLGLSLGGQEVVSGEATAVRGLLVRMEGLEVAWVLTGDAGLCAPEVAGAVVEQKGVTC
ncbi:MULTISPECIES: transposase family protein [unclassified Meiothermus]|uniref:transposase family protein n=1 Tax=unclassified Meiothermus TaxID=370471 RepID=UPI001F367C53|nr:MULTISPECIES: transposase family protein [unclassified Meiothermus]